MNVTLEHLPAENDWEDYLCIINKIFAEKPLYIFMLLSGVLLVVTGIKHIQSPTGTSLGFICLTIVFLILGILLLSFTRKRKPMITKTLQNTLGVSQYIHFSNTDITITSQNQQEPLHLSWKNILGQYCTNQYYIAYLNTKPHYLLIIKITPENRESLDQVIAFSARKGTPLKKLRV